VAGEIIGFYDGSTSKDGKRITLAGYAAKPEVWREVEAIWARVLADDTNRPKAKSLHMWQANSLDEEFSLAKGWDKAKIDSLLNDLSNECLSPYGMREPVEDALVGAVCTVELDDYARTQADCPYLQGMAPEEVCVNYVAEVALKMLPEDLNGLMGKTGSIEMYFDRNERFMRTIIGPWQRHRKKPGALKLIHNIEQVKDDSPVGIQAADFLAWHTNRDWWKRDGGEKDLLLRFRMIAAGLLTAHRYDYEKLMERYKDWPARGPDGRVLTPPLSA
jgi:hypothetical protein